MSCELIREFVKDLVWKGIAISPIHQLHIAGEQSLRELIIMGKVEVLITDSPVILSAAYQLIHSGQEWMSPAAIGFMKTAEATMNVTYLNLWLSREDANYEQDGRFEDLEQAILRDSQIHDFLRKINFDLEYVPAFDGDLRKKIQYIADLAMKRAKD
jgi:hypothetical protein